MNWKTIPHEALTEADARRIAALKDQHWTHGLASQLRWIADNTRPGDLHLLGEATDGDTSRLAAYLTLFRVKVRLDADELDALGVGCVCVDKTAQGSGMGKRLMRAAARVIRDRRQPGILLCKESLTGFYEKCGWTRLSYETATVAGAPYDKCIMTLEPMAAAASVQIDRNF